MARSLLILANDAIRERAIKWIKGAPDKTRVEFREPKRSLEQNAKMWSMLTDIATQKEHFGRRYTPDEWKVLMMHALGQEVRFIPSLDGASFIPLGHRSSDLGKAEMSELIEMMHAWGAQNGVVFHESSDDPS